MIDLSFHHTIPTSLSPDELWALVEHSFRDSRSSPLWPDELEVLECEDFEPGGRVRATYEFGPLQARQRYHLPHLDPEARELTYRVGSSHPLRGGSEVRVEAVGAGARLRWQGDYEMRRRPDALATAIYVKHYFEDRFFDALARNLRDIERERGAGEPPRTGADEASEVAA